MLDRKKHITMLSFCAAILLMICFALPVYALDSNLGLQFNSVILQANGGDTKWETVKQNGHIVLNTNTTGLEKGYYTSQLSVKAKMDWSSYGEVSFYVKNFSNKPVRINLFVILKDGTYLTVGSDEFVLLQKENQMDMKLANTQDGLIELNNDFTGSVRIPFENLKTTIQDLKNVISFGITTTTEENVIQKIEIGDFKLISHNNLSVPKEFSSLKIIGDKNITKPIIGESIAKYDLIVNSGQESQNKNKVSFYLKEKTEGVSITEDGRLIVLTNAPAEKINIKAVVNNDFSIIFEVVLLDSLVLNLKDKEGFSLAVPKPYEVQKIISSQDIFNRTDVIILFRIIIILISTTILTLYFIWRRKWKKENNS
ncbi:hypothetical protein [Clostridium ganghwense]|uniref:Cell wall anchor protein n=1 Tax=Clostridium ganghwense TaxID=312089 RepID=A0ABT4CXL3_9CLOT|nr:hypothetical protein [Clostridium ganghwense]MCY6372614.1 hypothetical protein [Clostridium ganghwense]